jgi:hypothetical protein
MNNELFEPEDGTPKAEMLQRLRSIGEAHPAFERMVKLLGSDTKALQAIREEAKFVRAHPELPRSAAFAEIVRGYLITNKLGWTQENLETAVAASAKENTL